MPQQRTIVLPTENKTSATDQPVDFLSKWTNWEEWPWLAFYFPLFFAWAYFCLRARSLWFFSSSNPTLTFGGFEGEGKDEMYNVLPAHTFPVTCYAEPTESFEVVLQRVQAHGLTYPFIVKPNIGMKGLLFRKIANSIELQRFHTLCPGKYILQEYAPWPIEIGVFYHRHPAQARGTITGLTQKTPPYVVGDGVATLESLIQRHIRSAKILSHLQPKFEVRLKEIVPNGDVWVLSEAGNRSQGGEVTNLNHLIDEPLCDIFDAISHHSGGFYYGRYDIKCASLEDLKAGKNYLILEFNGAGAAPNHVYHCGKSLFQAYREILQHWQIMFEVSKYNHKTGRARYWSFWEGLHFLRTGRKYLAILNSKDHEI